VGSDGTPYIGTVRTPQLNLRKLALESVAFGLGYVAVLIWIGSALVAAFGYDDASPYWPEITQLRTDTAGAIGFFIAIVALTTSRYLELRRRGGATGAQVPVVQVPEERRARVHLVQAVADTGMFLGTAIVIYLSCNAFAHPITMQMQLTHLLSWPSEGTVRVIGLAVCLVCVPLHRYLKATSAAPEQQVASTRSETAVVAAQKVDAAG
jgi:hypothetical protein